MKSLFAAVALATATLTLAACGGGGSSASPVPPSHPVSTATTTVKASFNSRGVSPQSSARRVTKGLVVVKSTSIQGAAVPTAVLDKPDAYIKYPATVAQVTAFAYLVNSDGSTPTLPSPAPAGAWAVSGAAITTSPTTIPSDWDTSLGPALPDALNVSHPTQVGITTYTDSVTGTLVGTATVTTDTFPGLGIELNNSNDMPSGGYAVNGVAFDASGTAQPQTSTSTADVYVSEDSNSKFWLVFPYGAVIDSNVGSIVGTSLPGSDVIPSASTSVSLAQLYNDGTDVVFFHTSDGRDGKLLGLSYGDEQVANPCGVNNGCIDSFYGVYLIGTSSGTFTQAGSRLAL